MITSPLPHDCNRKLKRRKPTSSLSVTASSRLNSVGTITRMFKGNAMTYYGRWTYKYEIAAQKGAATAIIIHETVPAAYPYSVVMSSWAKENFEIDAADKN